MSSPLKAKITKVVTCKENVTLPVIANFQNAIPYPENTVVHRVQDSLNGDDYILVASEDSVYKTDMSNTKSKPMKNFLAFKTKGSNELRLVEIQEASFKHTLYDNKDSAFENNILDAKKVLLKEFGGKKAAASYDRLKRTAPNIDVLEDTLEKHINTLDSEKFFERDVFDKSQDERQMFQDSIFPNIDTSSGSSVRDVFTAKKLLGVTIMEHLASVALEVLQKPVKELNFINSYIKRTIESIQYQRNADSNYNIERVSMLIYADALIRLINCRKRTFDNIVLSQISAQVDKDVRKNFSIEGRSINSKYTQQKSIIYYLIIILISTESLAIELDDILDGIERLSKTEMMKYAAIIGAKLKNKTTLYIHQPNLNKESKLSVPMPSAKRRRK